MWKIARHARIVLCVPPRESAEGIAIVVGAGDAAAAVCEGDAAVAAVWIAIAAHGAAPIVRRPGIEAVLIVRRLEIGAVPTVRRLQIAGVPIVRVPIVQLLTVVATARAAGV